MRLAISATMVRQVGSACANVASLQDQHTRGQIKQGTIEDAHQPAMQDHEDPASARCGPENVARGHPFAYPVDEGHGGEAKASATKGPARSPTCQAVFQGRRGVWRKGQALIQQVAADLGRSVAGSGSARVSSLGPSGGVSGYMQAFARRSAPMLSHLGGLAKGKHLESSRRADVICASDMIGLFKHIGSGRGWPSRFQRRRAGRGWAGYDPPPHRLPPDIPRPKDTGPMTGKNALRQESGTAQTSSMRARGWHQPSLHRRVNLVHERSPARRPIRGASHGPGRQPSTSARRKTIAVPRTTTCGRPRAATTPTKMPEDSRIQVAALDTKRRRNRHPLNYPVSDVRQGIVQ